MKLHFFLFPIIALLMVGCLLSPDKEQSDITFYRTDTESLKTYVNDGPMPENPNLSIDKVIVNNEYPIEISLYSDSKFYYNLPKLGDGVGEWHQKEGRIELFAKRSLFDMYIEVLALDENAENVAIRFRDRFGSKTLEMLNVNIDD